MQYVDMCSLFSLFIYYTYNLSFGHPIKHSTFVILLYSITILVKIKYPFPIILWRVY